MGVPQDKVDYGIRLVTNKTMLVSIVTIVGGSLFFSPFFPLFWLALAGGISGVVVAVHRTDAATAAEKGPQGIGSTGSPAGAENTWKWSNISPAKILSFFS